VLAITFIHYSKDGQMRSAPTITDQDPLDQPISSGRIDETVVFKRAGYAGFHTVAKNTLHFTDLG
jgi:hypothetical protein